MPPCSRHPHAHKVIADAVALPLPALVPLACGCQGYYLTFMSCGLWNEVARLLRRHLRPLVIPTKEAEKSFKASLYHVASFALTISSLNYLATPFLLLSGV